MLHFVFKKINYKNHDDSIFSDGLKLKIVLDRISVVCIND